MTAHIEQVILHRRRVPLVRPFVTAIRTATAVDALLVEVKDSDGRSGWGEAPTSWRVTGESPESVTAAVEGPLREAVRGLPADDPEGGSAVMARALIRNSSARMAVDCALYDLAAQHAGLPLFRYFGGETDRVATDMTLSAVVENEHIPSLVSSAVEHRDAGFRTLKVKVGAGGDDVAAMRAVREAVGYDVLLRADANQGWDRARAISTIRAWEDAGVGLQLIEQPVRMDDLDSLAAVCGQVSTPVMADESVWTLREAREVIDRRAATMINVKLAKSGGLREGRAIARYAAEHGVPVIVGCMMESSVGIASAVSLAAAIDTDPSASAAAVPLAHDLDAGAWLARSPVLGGVVYRAETVVLSGEPGLGIRSLAPEDRELA